MSDRRRRLPWLALALAIVACDTGPPPDPTQIILVRNNGLLALQQDRLDEAEASFAELVDMTPREAVGYAYLGLLELRRGNLERAEDLIREGLERDDQDPEVHRFLAAVLVARGEYAEAREAVRAALSLEPTDLRSLWALSEIGRESADGGPERLSTLTTLVEVAPANLAARFEWADALVAASLPDSAAGALESLRQQLPVLPQRIGQAFDSSLVLLQDGNATEARPLLEDFGAFFRASGPYQASYDEVRGPEPEIVGIPDFTFSFEFSLAVQEQEAVLAALRFADGSEIAGLADHPLAAAPAAIGTADYDGDGDDDLLAAGSDSPLATLHRVDLGLFVDASTEADLGPAPSTVFVASGDYDNDGWIDAVRVGTDGLRLSRNLGGGAFEDATASAGLADAPGGTHALWADLDHDGDLDLLVSGAGVRLHRNDGDGSFTETTEAWGLVPDTGAAEAAYADLDDDGDLDLLLVGGGSAPRLYTNERGGSFTEIASSVGLGTAEAEALVVADFDRDGGLDIVLSSPARTKLWVNDGRGSFSSTAWTGPGARFIRSLDFDNDGAFDLLLGGDGGLRLLRGDGLGDFEDFTDRLPAAEESYRSASVMDYNEDGDLDLLLTAETGFRLLRNDGGNANHYLQIDLEGLAAGSGKNNRDGIGTRIEVTAGDLYQVHLVTRSGIHVGLGSRRKADVIRIEWTNGVPQDIYFPGTDQDLEEQILKGSCPMLFTWNGERFEFQKDVMWKSALGMPTGIQGNQGTRSYGPAAASHEYVRIPGDQLTEREGQYELRITEELWETIYMDEIRLLAVDHPEEIDVYVDERFVPADAPVAYAPTTVRSPVVPRAASDDRGRDVLEALHERDHVYVSGFLRGPLQGLAEPHAITLDLGPEVASSDHARLYLTGWVFPADASLNVAMAQSDRYVMEAPVLEVPDGRGGWRVALDDVSFPSGKDKTLVLDIAGVVPESDPRVRIRTSMQIYWDQAFASIDPPEPEVRTTELALTDAELRYHGFSHTYRKGGRYGPHWFDYDSVTTAPKWRDLVGQYTRYGDVTELLTAPDDRYVVMNAGDEVAIRFGASSGPELPPGWVRDFVLYTVGWVKDGDLNTATGSTVEPLPFHGMERYPYGDDQTYPSDAEHLRYLREYNTRSVGPAGR